jgi:AraC family transcriptional regulator of adaptative response/methylated-DNA-[protein]-cysteine methyltransferase
VKEQIMNETSIRFASAPVDNASLGRVLAAQSPQGLCAILLGDDEAALRAELSLVFPRADLIEEPGSLKRVLADVVALVQMRGSNVLAFDHPLDLGGTPFQQRVWQALREIPTGSRVTYTEMAARVGRPDAVRAVAGACAANRHAVVIPCHRVVGRNGSLTGYRWGLARKQQLLALEARR